MAEARADSKARTLRLIEDKALLTAAELQDAMNVTQSELDDAVASDQIFSITAPDGKEYYPAFLCELPNWQVIKIIALELRGLPGSSQFYFFNRPCYTLDGLTPLAALRQGQIQKVKQAATCFLMM